VSDDKDEREHANGTRNR
jgi:hypothetical protein